MLRPSLSRTKGYTTNAVSIKSAGLDNPSPFFKFGHGKASATASLMSLEECFVESPQEAMFSPSVATLMGPSRPKSAFPNPNGMIRSNGSPLPGCIRKPSAPMQRPRKQFRRSLSMFEHPGDVMKKQQENEQRTDCGLQSAMDLDDTPELRLPHFFANEESIPRISKDTMIAFLDGKYSQNYDSSVVIDCRFEYEYKGGHIDGAINFNNKEELGVKLFEQSPSHRTILIFHCEYSAHRAPIA